MLQKIITAYKSQRQPIRWFLVFMILTWAFYGSTVSLGFFSDDFGMFYTMQEQVGVWRYFGQNLLGTIGGHSYGPLFNLSFIAQQSIFGFNATGFHVVSLFVHALTTWLVFLFASRLFLNRQIGVLAGLFFLLFPNRVEALVWPAVQPHLFATLLYVLALYWYQRFVVEKEYWFYGGAIIAFTASLLFKEIGITFIATAALLHALQATRKKQAFTTSIKETAIHLLAPLGVIGGYLLARGYTTGAALGYYGGSTSVPFTQKVQMFFELIVSFFVSAPHRYDIALVLTEWWWVIALIAIVKMVALWFLYKHLRVLAYGLTAFLLITAAPFLSLQFHPYTNEGDRYTYLLGVPMALLISWSLYQLPSLLKKRIMQYVPVLVLVGFTLFVIPQLDAKIAHWEAAATVRDRIVESSAIESEGPLYALGLPDNVVGAQVLRNGYREAIALTHGEEYLDVFGDRVQIYTMFVSAPNEPVITLVDDSLRATSSSMVQFTGFPTQSRGDVTYTMENFRQPGHLGDGVTVSEGTGPLWYFTGMAMELVE